MCCLRNNKICSLLHKEDLLQAWFQRKQACPKYFWKNIRKMEVVLSSILKVQEKWVVHCQTEMVEKYLGIT